MYIYTYIYYMYIIAWADLWGWSGGGGVHDLIG